MGILFNNELNRLLYVIRENVTNQLLTLYLYSPQNLDLTSSVIERSDTQVHRVLLLRLLLQDTRLQSLQTTNALLLRLCKRCTLLDPHSLQSQLPPF